MKMWLRDARKRGWLAVGIILILAIGLAWPLVGGSASRHLTAYDSGPEDISAFRDVLGGKAGKVSAILSTPLVLNDVRRAEGTLYVAIGPERAYDAAEARAILGFLERGGNVLLADEKGFGDAIANAAGWKFEAHRVLDTRGYQNDVKLPVVTDARPDAGASGEFRIVFNEPSKLTPLSSAKDFAILARSSPANAGNGSYFDLNDDGIIDRGDQPGPFPFIISTRFGSGQLVLVSDTGLFMGAQMNIRDARNAEYLAALISPLIGAQGTVFIDESRHAPTAAYAPFQAPLRAMGRATQSGIMPYVTFTVLVLGAVLAWRSTRDTEDWSHHDHRLDVIVEGPETVRPDHERIQRLARRRISERYNIPLEQVAAMTAERLQAITGDKTLAEAAAGTLRSDPTSLFDSYAPISSSPEVQP